MNKFIKIYDSLIRVDTIQSISKSYRLISHIDRTKPATAVYQLEVKYQGDPDVFTYGTDLEKRDSEYDRIKEALG